MVDKVRITDAKTAYSNHIEQLKKQKSKLDMQKAEQMQQQNVQAKDKSNINLGIKLDLTATDKKISALNNAIEKTQDALTGLQSYESAMKEYESGKQNAEAQADAMDELIKMIEISRRISTGGRVPWEDEKKLMEFSHEMYMLAKSAAMMAKEHEEYDSLFEEEASEEEEVSGVEDVDVTVPSEFTTTSVSESAPSEE